MSKKRTPTGGNNEYQKRGRSNKRAGYYYEKRLESLAKAAGLSAYRNPGSGAYKGLEGDVLIEGRRAEVKARQGGFAFDEFLDPERGNDILVTFTRGRRGGNPIVRLRLRDYLDLIRENRLLRAASEVQIRGIE